MLTTRRLPLLIYQLGTLRYKYRRDGSVVAEQTKVSSCMALSCASLLALCTLLVGISVIHAEPSNPQARPIVKALVSAGLGRRDKPNEPQSSSSMFADIEDLTDSSIKTRLGTLARGSQVEHLGNLPNDFDRLIERLTSSQPVQENRRPTSLNQPVTGVSGTIDTNIPGNNKTTMRFFRNNKTFASIVYTSEPNQADVASKNQYQPRQPRRLINCHLVDLEKHSTDVVLFETKYDIKTIDLEFKDMMQIIEACTNIARLRRPAFLNPNGNNSRVSTSPQMASSSPHVVVGRPMPMPVATTQSVVGGKQSPPVQSIATFQSVMTGTLNSELQMLGPTVDDSPKLDLPQTTPTVMQGIGQQQKRYKRLFSTRPPNRGPLTQALAKVGGVGKKLVLGEVTPSPSAIDGGSGGLKEALQEITNYDTTDLLAIWRGILPGTNWCGMGDRATSYNDLGFESDIDICCRAHDFCPIRLSAFSSGYGLFNWSFYTRSHCWCDQNFLDCLQQAKSPLSSVILKFYFSIMKTTCLNDDETSLSHSQSMLQSRNRSSPMARFQLFGQLLGAPQQPLMIPAIRQSKLIQTKFEQHNGRRGLNGNKRTDTVTRYG